MRELRREGAEPARAVLQQVRRVAGRALPTTADRGAQRLKVDPRVGAFWYLVDRDSATIVVRMRSLRDTSRVERASLKNRATPRQAHAEPHAGGCRA